MEEMEKETLDDDMPDRRRKPRANRRGAEEMRW
jgi:hypothetical protein